MRFNVALRVVASVSLCTGVAFAAGNPAFAPDAPPVAARISFSQPDAQNNVTVTGAAGAVLPQSHLIAIDLSTGHYAITRAVADGSFSVTVTAPAGTTLLIKADPFGKVLPAFDEKSNDWRMFGALPGTLIRVPDAQGAPAAGVAFSTAGRSGVRGAYFTARGVVNTLAFAIGEEMTITTTVVVHASALDSASRPTLRFAIAFARVTTPEGTEVAKDNAFGSTFLTPTDLPIEGAQRCGRTVFKDDATEPMTTTAGRAEVTKRVSLAIPPQLLPGYYQPYLMLFFDGIPPATEEKGIVNGGGLPNFWLSINAPLIRVGNPAPPRLTSLLFADFWSHGTRGVRAIEDRRLYGFAAQIATQSDVLVLPRGRYRLEPHIPTMAISDRGSPIREPRFALRLPSGTLTARLTRPDGNSTTVGPSPIAQARVIAPAKESGESFDIGSHHPGDIYQLSTMDGPFEANFDQYGRYRVVLDGSVDDLWGTSWRISGTYEVIIAEALVLDTAVLPGTPFEVGDRPSFVVTTIPPVAAEIEATFRLAAQSDWLRMRETTSRGRANRFGVFAPFVDSAVASEAGEYRIDLVATHVDTRGVWWAGLRTWGGIVAPKDTALIAHGRRGVFFQEAPRQPWFFESQAGQLRFDSHPTFPFFSSDIIWIDPRKAMLVAVNQQDPTGEIDALVASRCPPQDALPGETPLISSRADGLDPHFDPSAVDLRSYAYASVQRPLIRVRELIGDGIEGHGFGYWVFREHYGAQPGVPNGDRPNDIKFLFGGAVSRGPALKKPQYAIYGALFVALPYDDTSGGTRVFPPFQGNGGGSSGGPIMMLKGKPVDIFFHSTAVRPGTILERGSKGVFAGYTAPPLPAKLEIVITSPSGSRRTLTGQANRIGYINEALFEIDVPGVWRAKVRVWFDGVLPSTNGQVQPPYPSGDVLGSREGEFYFYVTGGETPPLDVRVDMGRQDGSTGPVTFDAVLPAGLTDVELYYTAMMPGVILEEGSTRQLRYVYDAHRLAQQFPNLDLQDGSAYFETITVSLLLTGTDGAGVRRHFARQIVLQGEELQMPEQKPNATVRGRAVRR